MPPIHKNGNVHKPHHLAEDFGVTAIHTVKSIQEIQEEREIEEKTLDEATEKRDQWGSQLQFVLACVGYVVGLGNIWRFPSLAYEHGGGAFLIPYLICSILFGIPVVLLELSIGQYTQAGPSVALSYYAPIAEGLGWAMALVGSTVGMYYNVVVSWSLIYLFKIVTGESWHWSSCRNWWNTEYCESSLEDQRCIDMTNGTHTYYFNGSCYDSLFKAAVKSMNRLPPVSPAEEFFENFVTLRSSGISDLNGMNWKVLCALFIVWSLVTCAMSKGVKYVGKIAYFSATVPYFIIMLMFIRGVTLDGAYEGLRFYLLEPDFKYIFMLNTWKAALTHVCFSLSVGMGGLLAMASYNPLHHNSYRDVLTVVIADNFMNVFGGTAVFSTLGFIATQLGQPIHEVVQSGSSLMFVVYPEAISRMPLSWLWAFLFFFMLFVLGITTTFGYTQVLVTCIRDEFPSIREYRLLITIATSLFHFSGGVIICTKAGLYWFNVFNDFTGSTCICLVAICELFLVIYVYGLRNWVLDMQIMFGEPQTRLQRWLGSSGYLLRFEWAILAPIFGTFIFISTFFRDKLTFGKGVRTYTYPPWAEAFGWLLVAVPASCIPIFAVYNVLKYRRNKWPMAELFRIQPKLRSFDRIRGSREMRRSADNIDVAV